MEIGDDGWGHGGKIIKYAQRADTKKYRLFLSCRTFRGILYC